MMQSADVVKRKVIEAFAGTPNPGDEKLCADQSGYDPECQEIAAAFKGKQWKDVTVEMVRKYGDALPLFTPAAFRYLLPAYVLAVINSYYDVDVARDGVLFNLTPPKKQDGWEWDFFWTRAQKFNQREADAISSFLELMKEYEIIDWASEGLQPPKGQVERALDFWNELAARA